MRIRIAASVVGLLVLATSVPTLQAQRGGGGRGGAGSGGGRGNGGGGGMQRPPTAPPPSRPPASVTIANPAPSTPILPIGNPVAPIMNPIQPIIRYGGSGTPTVVIQSNVPGRTTSGAPIPVRDRGLDRRRGNTVVVGGGGYLFPDYAYGLPYYAYGQPYYGQPYPTAELVPGQLPGVYYPPEQDASPAYVAPTAPPPVTPVEPPPTFFPEPNVIINLPEPERTIEPPSIGTSRADVLNRYGQPWGSMVTSANETLYFKGVTVVFVEGKVSQVR